MLAALGALCTFAAVVEALAATLDDVDAASDLQPAHKPSSKMTRNFMPYLRCDHASRSVDPTLVVGRSWLSGDPNMRKHWRMALGAAVFLTLPLVAQASSHREAPFISKNPQVDGTDFYMFRSYETGRSAFVTVVANYLPLQDAFGGPNYFNLDPNALYEIMIDNTGDGVEDLTFQFNFQQALANGGAGLGVPVADGGTIAVPFTNIGDATNAANVNVIQTFTVNMVTGPRRSGTAAAVKNHASAATTFNKPLDNIGTKSFSNYANYAAGFVYNIDIPNCSTQGKMFVGQRAESFAVNLGPTFDLINAPASVITGTAGPQVVPNPLAKKNVTSLELELPIACITQNTSQPIIGGWTTASIRQARVVNPGATYTVPSHEGGAWTQVSRLSSPLVNELVIGLPDKDHFNASEPKDDAQFAKYVEYPTLPVIIDLLFGPGIKPADAAYPRADLVEAFLTGVPTVNKFSGGAAAEMLRLNTAVAVTPAGSQNYLGAAVCVLGGTVNLGATGCDPAGFPNGRRPGDDVVDIALDVMMGALLPTTQAPLYAGAQPTLLTDGVQQQDSQFDATFPYLKTPTQGANGNGT